jgi:hypothetical protein
LLKPGFFTNDVLAELPMAGRLLFAGIWTLADREGRLEDRPRKIKAEVLPYDDADVDALLTDLAEHGFLLRYEYGHVRYIQIINFGKHQSPHVKEPPSVIPPPDMPDASPVLTPDMPDASPSSRAHSPIPHSPFPIPIAEAEAEKGTRGRAADEPPTPIAVQVIDSVSEITDDKPYDLVAMLCEENGKEVKTMPPDWASRQRGIAKRLIEQGHSIEQVRAYVRFRKTAWNGNTPFDLRHVEKDIAAWELAGCPSVEAARASPNGHAPALSRATLIDRSDVYLRNGKELSDAEKQRIEDIGNRARARREAEAANGA